MTTTRWQKVPDGTALTGHRWRGIPARAQCKCCGLRFVVMASAGNEGVALMWDGTGAWDCPDAERYSVRLSGLTQLD